MRSSFRFFFALALAGCANPDTSPDLSGRDLGRGGGSQDLSVSDSGGSDDQSVPVDGSGGKDMGGGGCMQVATWPGLNPAAGYDPSVPETYLFSNRQPMEPLDVLAVEDFHTMMNETYPKALTLSTKDSFATCDVCVRLLEGCTQANGCTRGYFAQGGSLTVTKADTNPDVGRVTVSGTNIKLVEWNFPVPTDGGYTGDVPVPGGKCWQIGDVKLDVMWNTVDGGTDLAGPPVDMAGVDLAGTAPDLAGTTCTPVINEVMTGVTGDARNEFVEIYNPCGVAIDLTGWKLVYRSAANQNPASGADSSTLFSWTAGTTPHTIGASGASAYLVYGGVDFNNANKTGTLLNSIADGGGAVGLRDPTGKLVDSVGYGSASPIDAFVEGGTAAPAPPVVASPGNSISRIPNGTDTNRNNVDWKVSTMITPGAANQ